MPSDPVRSPLGDQHVCSVPGCSRLSCFQVRLEAGVAPRHPGRIAGAAGVASVARALAHEPPAPAREPAGSAREPADPDHKPAGPDHKAAGPGREPTDPGRELSGPAREPAGPGREHAGPGRELSGPARELAGPGCDAAARAGDSCGTHLTDVVQAMAHRGRSGSAGAAHIVVYATPEGWHGKENGQASPFDRLPLGVIPI